MALQATRKRGRRVDSVPTLPISLGLRGSRSLWTGLWSFNNLFNATYKLLDVSFARTHDLTRSTRPLVPLRAALAR